MIGVADDPRRNIVPTYHWDFFGPDARKTAEHFVRHLDEFITREGLEGCETGAASEQSNHYGAW